MVKRASPPAPAPAGLGPPPPSPRRKSAPVIGASYRRGARGRRPARVYFQFKRDAGPRRPVRGRITGAGSVGRAGPIRLRLPGATTRPLLSRTGSPWRPIYTNPGSHATGPDRGSPNGRTRDHPGPTHPITPTRNRKRGPGEQTYVPDTLEHSHTDPHVGAWTCRPHPMDLVTSVGQTLRSRDTRS